jgi:hypothetical protein
MARSRNKYSRARMRSRTRRPKRRGGAKWFYLALAVIVAVGVVGVVASSGSEAQVHPFVLDPQTGTGDHWHAAFNVNICGQWLDNPPQFTTVDNENLVYAGLHTHADGFIHVEAASPSEAGNNATVGRFLDYSPGYGISDSTLDVWPAGAQDLLSGTPRADPTKTHYENGDKCPAGSPMAGRRGLVSWSLDCKVQRSDANDHKIADGDVIAFAFLPKGEAIGTPPNADAAPLGSDGKPLPSFTTKKSCTTSGPGGTARAGTATTIPTTAPAATPTSTP